MTKNFTSVWNNCLLTIKEHVNEQSFRTWFQPIQPLRIEGSTLTIQVPSQFFYEWLEEHYVGLLKKAIFNELGGEGRLEYSVIVDKGNMTNNPLTVNLPGKEKKGAFGNTHDKYRAPEITIERLSPNLNSKYNFDTFIEGDYNRLPRSAGMAVAMNPGTTSFNPLTIFGGVGLGKTHLIQAIGNEVVKKFPDMKVVHTTSERFTNDFFEAIRGNRIQDFYKSYADMDVLIIDDVQFLGGKEKTQEIFFNIFNHLHMNGKQIIMTSDRPLTELKGLSERLLSRFKWGLNAELLQTDFETRLAIILNKITSDGIEIPTDVIEYLAYSIDTNIRELEGVLISLIAQSTLLRKELDLELAKSCIQNIVHEVDGEVSIDYIQKYVANYCGIEVALLKSKTRKQEIVQPRQIAMYFAKEYTSHALATIGEYFGGKDHSTVIHSVNSVKNLIQTDKKFKAKINEMQKKLKIKSI